MFSLDTKFPLDEQDEIFLVSQRKYNLDPHRPWWETAFFRYLWLPIVRFGFKWMHIAGPGAYEPCGKCETCVHKEVCGQCHNPRIALIEQQGVFSDRANADKACKNEFYSVKALPLDTELPQVSIQYKGHRAPASVIPDRYRRRTFPYTAKPCAEVAAEQKGVEALIQQVDRMRAKLKSSAVL